MKIIITWFAVPLLLFFVLQLLKDAGLEKYPSMAKQEGAIIHKIYFFFLKQGLYAEILISFNNDRKIFRFLQTHALRLHLNEMYSKEHMILQDL